MLMQKTWQSAQSQGLFKPCCTADASFRTMCTMYSVGLKRMVWLLFMSSCRDNRKLPWRTPRHRFGILVRSSRVVRERNVSLCWRCAIAHPAILRQSGAAIRVTLSFLSAQAKIDFLFFEIVQIYFKNQAPAPGTSHARHLPLREVVSIVIDSFTGATERHIDVRSPSATFLKTFYFAQLPRWLFRLVMVWRSLSFLGKGGLLKICRGWPVFRKRLLHPMVNVLS